MTRTWFRVRYDAERGCEVKGCSACRVEKPVTEFYRRPGGYHGRCKACQDAINKQRYDANPEKYRAKSREYARQHPEEHRARYERWAEANQERRLAYYREYNETHREERRTLDRVRHAKETPEFRAHWYRRRVVYFRRYVAEHADRMAHNSREWRRRKPWMHAETQARRRACKFNAPRVEVIRRLALIERDKWTCYLCQCICTVENVTLDHIVPLVRGGSHTADNLRVACRSCNARKGTKLLDEFI